MNKSERNNDIFMLQVRLFRLLQEKKNITAKECDELFAEYELYDYIATCYEEYHVQGDDANLEDIENYIYSQGEKA